MGWLRLAGSGVPGLGTREGREMNTDGTLPSVALSFLLFLESRLCAPLAKPQVWRSSLDPGPPFPHRVTT